MQYLNVCCEQTFSLSVILIVLDIVCDPGLFKHLYMHQMQSMQDDKSLKRVSSYNIYAVWRMERDTDHH